VLQEFYPGKELKDEEQRFMANLKGCIRKLRKRESWGMLMWNLERNMAAQQMSENIA